MECPLLPLEEENPSLISNHCAIQTFRNRTSTDEELYVVPTEIIVLLSIFYGSISVTAVVGNFLVMWIIATNRRMHNVTYYYIANLALADIVIALFSIPFQFQAALLQRWNLPHFMCPFCPFVQMLSVSVSIFTLTAIAVDRHRAVVKPLSVRPSKLQAKIAISFVWSLGAILATPMAMALRVKNTVDFDLIGRIQVIPFCQNVNFSDKTMVYYKCILFLLQYAVPLCIIIWAYTRMAHRLWSAKAPGNAQDARDATIMKNKKKVIKMLVIVVALFALCWLPLQTYRVLEVIFPRINGYRYINIVWFCFDWLAMSNSCYNPFIYGIYNEKFKKEFKTRFPAFWTRHWSPSYSTDSIDLERSTNQTLVPTRVSVKLPRNDSSCNYWEVHQIRGKRRDGSNSKSKHQFKLIKFSEKNIYFDVSGDKYLNSENYSEIGSGKYQFSPMLSDRNDDDDGKHSETLSTSFKSSTKSLNNLVSS